MLRPSNPSSTCNTDSNEWVTVSTANYMRLVFANWFRRYRMWFTIPIAIAAAIAIKIDSRFWLVLLMMICIIGPMIVMFVYFNYSLTPEAAACRRPHRAERHPDGSLTLHFRPDPESGREYQPYRLAADNIAATAVCGPHTVFTLKSSPYRYIFI